MADAWPILSTTDLVNPDGFSVVVSQGPNGTAVRIVKVRTDVEGPERFHTRDGLSVPKAMPLDLFSEEVAAVLDAARKVGQSEPKAKAAKGGKAVVKQADPTVIAALASNPEALQAYLQSLA